MHREKQYLFSCSIVAGLLLCMACDTPSGAKATSRTATQPEVSYSLEQRLRLLADTHLEGSPLLGWERFTNTNLYRCELSKGWFSSYRKPDEPGFVTLGGEYGIYMTEQGLVYLCRLALHGQWCDIVPPPSSIGDTRKAFHQIVLKHGGQLDGLDRGPPRPMLVLLYTPNLMSGENSDSMMVFFSSRNTNRIFALHYCGGKYTVTGNVSAAEGFWFNDETPE